MRKLFLYSLVLISFLAKAQKKEKDTDLPKGNDAFVEKNTAMPKQNTEFRSLKTRKNRLLLIT
jgi:hypothetical protein